MRATTRRRPFASGDPALSPVTVLDLRDPASPSDTDVREPELVVCVCRL